MTGSEMETPGQRLRSPGSVASFDHPGDVDACLACARTIGWTAPPEAWALMLEIGRGFGATAKGALAGAAIAFPFGDVFAMVAMMMVRADVQRQGVGRALMAHLQAQAATRNITRLWAHVSLAAEAFFTAQGFVVEQRQEVPRADQMLCNARMAKMLGTMVQNHQKS